MSDHSKSHGSKSHGSKSGGHGGKSKTGATPLSEHPILHGAVDNFLRGCAATENRSRLEEGLTAAGAAKNGEDLLGAALHHGNLGLGFAEAWRFVFFIAAAPAVAEEAGEAVWGGGAFDTNVGRRIIEAKLDLGVEALLSEGFGSDSSDDSSDDLDEEEDALENGHKGNKK